MSQLDATSAAEEFAACSLYASPRWLAIQAEGGRPPSRIVTAAAPNGRPRCLLPIYDVLPTRNARYGTKHLFRGVPASAHPGALMFGGLISGYQTDIALAQAVDADAVLASALHQARAPRPESVLVLPYARHELAVRLAKLEPSATLLLEAADAWLINPYDSVEALWAASSARIRHVIRHDERRFAASGLDPAVLPLGEHIQAFAALVSQHAARHGLTESAVELAIYLAAVSRHFGEDAVLLAALERGRLVAGALGLIHGKYLYMRMVGNEPSAVAGTAAHFVLSFYNALRYSSARRLHGVHVGLSLDRTKRARGAKLLPLWTVVIGGDLRGFDARTLMAARLSELSQTDPSGARDLCQTLSLDESVSR